MSEDLLFIDVFLNNVPEECRNLKIPYDKNYKTFRQNATDKFLSMKCGTINSNQYFNFMYRGKPLWK